MFCERVSGGDYLHPEGKPLVDTSSLKLYFSVFFPFFIYFYLLLDSAETRNTPRGRGKNAPLPDEGPCPFHTLAAFTTFVQY